MGTSFSSRWSARLSALPRARTSPDRRFRPHLEALEDRFLPSTLTVTNLSDHDAGSLRAAIAQAAPGDTIVFNPLQARGTIHLTSGQLTIDKSLTILGLSAGQTGISGNHASRVLAIPAGVNVTLAGLTISDGLLDVTSSSSDVTVVGGGIANAGNLTLSDCTVSGNTVNFNLASDSGASLSGYGYGGGIANTGTLTLNACTIYNNGSTSSVEASNGGVASGYSYGGGIYNTGTLTAYASGVYNNGVGGSASAAYVSWYGGGIYSTGNVTLVDSGVSGNQAYGGEANSVFSWTGGGVYSSGTLTVIDSTISYNYAVDDGGGIYNTGRLDLDGSNIWGNGIGGGFGYSGAFSLTTSGAGINNTGGIATMTDCTVAYNSASPSMSDDGGGTEQLLGLGVYNSGSLAMTNCTVANNSGFQSLSDDGTGSVLVLGGGVYNRGSLTLTSCTTAGNSTSGSTTDSAELHASGGGIFNDSFSGATVSVKNTIVAGNAAQTSSPDAAGIFASHGFNLIGIADGSSGWTGADLTGSSSTPLNPLLGPLQDNGGPTQTMALLPGSPAVDAGDNTGAPAFDQRGVGYPRIVGDIIDIGAFEVQNGPGGGAVGAGAHDNAIGGTASGAGNVIAFNGNDGVLIDTGTSNAISQNSIFGNANLGVELLNGGNNDEPAPQLDSAVAGGGVAVVQGTFTGQTLTIYTLEFFAADRSSQGQQFLGSLTVTTDDNGVAV
jgi:hypothetical protein